MKIAVARSGGFAGIARRAESDTGSLPPAQRERIESLARAAELEPVAGGAQPDAFTYTVDIDGRRYLVRDARGAWGTLIEAVMKAAGR